MYYTPFPILALTLLLSRVAAAHPTAEIAQRGAMKEISELNVRAPQIDDPIPVMAPAGGDPVPFSNGKRVFEIKKEVRATEKETALEKRDVPYQKLAWRSDGVNMVPFSERDAAILNELAGSV